MTLHYGENDIGGVRVEVVRRKAKYIRIRVKADGTVALTVPFWRATIAQGAAFLESKWAWALEARKRAMERPRAPAPAEEPPEDIAALEALLAELHGAWAERLGEGGTSWKMRRMKTRWGVCNWVKRRVTYATMLARKPRKLVEYVVVHELTHLKAHGHGAAFQALMDARLPGWRALRRRLNAADARGRDEE